MKLNLNGIEIELPNNAKVDVSKDGKSIKIDFPEADVKERIRVVEVPVEGTPVERIIERIKVVEVERPCQLQHYPTYNWPNTYPYTITCGGQSTGIVTGGLQTGVTYQSGTATVAGDPTITIANAGILGQSNMTCNDPNLLTGSGMTSYTITN